MSVSADRIFSVQAALLLPFEHSSTTSYSQNRKNHVGMVKDRVLNVSFRSQVVTVGVLLGYVDVLPSLPSS